MVGRKERFGWPRQEESGSRLPNSPPAGATKLVVVDPRLVFTHPHPRGGGSATATDPVRPCFIDSPLPDAQTLKPSTRPCSGPLHLIRSLRGNSSDGEVLASTAWSRAPALIRPSASCEMMTTPSQKDVVATISKRVRPHCWRKLSYHCAPGHIAIAMVSCNWSVHAAGRCRSGNCFVVLARGPSLRWRRLHWCAIHFLAFHV